MAPAWAKLRSSMKQPSSGSKVSLPGNHTTWVLTGFSQHMAMLSLMFNLQKITKAGHLVHYLDCPAGLCPYLWALARTFPAHTLCSEFDAKWKQTNTIIQNNRTVFFYYKFWLSWRTLRNYFDQNTWVSCLLNMGTDLSWRILAANLSFQFYF